MVTLPEGWLVHPAHTKHFLLFCLISSSMSFVVLYQDGNRMFSLIRLHVISVGSLQLCAVTKAISNKVIFVSFVYSFFWVIQFSGTHHTLLVSMEIVSSLKSVLFQPGIHIYCWKSCKSSLLNAHRV